MIFLSTLHLASQQLQETVPLMFQEILELADQLTDQTRQLLIDFVYYGLLGTCLAAALCLLIGSLLLVKHARLLKEAPPALRVIQAVPTHRRSKRLVKNRTARTNRANQQSVSTRSLAGPLRN